MSRDLRGFWKEQKKISKPYQPFRKKKSRRRISKREVISLSKFEREFSKQDKHLKAIMDEI